MSQPSNSQDKNKNAASVPSRDQGAPLPASATGTPRVAAKGASQETAVRTDRTDGQRDSSGQVRSATGSRALQEAFGGTEERGDRTDRGERTDRNERGEPTLRQAMSELAQSVECLCGDSSQKDTAGARRHLDQAKRFLGDSLSGGTGSRSTPGRNGPQASSSSSEDSSEEQDAANLR
jgi:transcription termination factor Rho